MGNTIRFQFSKGNEVRFLSHLDLVRTMERAIRRAKLPIAFSEGFNPRPKISFGFPLAVGILSRAEYGDFQFTETVEPSEFQTALNENLPDGLAVIKAQALQGKDSLMTLINSASYEILLPDRAKEAVLERWAWLKNLDTFFLERKTKRGTREVDVLPMLYDLNVEEGQDGVIVTCFCALGKNANLRMEELGRLLEFDHLATLITRTGQYKKEGSKYCPPWGN